MIKMLYDTYDYLRQVLYPKEAVVVGLTFDGVSVIYTINVPAGDQGCIGMGLTLEQAISNLIALRRKKAEKDAKKPPQEPLPNLREHPETR